MTTADMVRVGREIMEGKGICLTCHTIGKTGALRFPDLGGIGTAAATRVAGMSDDFSDSLDHHGVTSFVVPGFRALLPAVFFPPIGLTDQEILCVIAALQSQGGTPTVTMQTTHRYYSGSAAGGAQAPASPPPAAGGTAQ